MWRVKRWRPQLAKVKVVQKNGGEQKGQKAKKTTNGKENRTEQNKETAKRWRWRGGDSGS